VTFAERHKGSEADLTAELADLLRSAVKSRMVADVPLGAFLSGGVDSSSVVALMAEESSHPVRTCSIGFDVKALDETGYAEQIAALRHRSCQPHRQPRRFRGGGSSGRHVRRALRRCQRPADMARLPTGARKRDGGPVGRWRG
jgi:hypothetical protein